MRVLHVLDHSLPIHSGYSFRTANILDWQREQGWEVTAITGPKHNSAEEVNSNHWHPAYLRAPYKGYQNKLPGFLKQLAVISVLRDKIISVCGTRPFDLMHVHSPSLNGLAALAAQRKVRLPLIYEMRASWEDASVDHGVTKEESIRYRLTRLSETFALRRADHITTICEGLRTEIRSRGIPDERISVVPNAVDVEKFFPTPDLVEELKKQYSAEGRSVLVYCGSFYAYEGLSLLVDAVDKLRTRRPEILLILAGGGPEEESLEEAIRLRGLGAHIRMLGRIAQAEVNRLYNLANICVFPRLPMRLTEIVTPLKPLEAMAAGGVVLASMVGGHRELIRHGDNGFLFQAGDVDALKSAIEECLNANGNAAIRKASRNFVKENRVWSKCCDQYLQAYENALQFRPVGA